MLKFHLVTDTHYYNNDALGHSNHTDQKTLNESGAIIDAAFEKIIEQTDTDIVLIAGDLSNNGERAGHDGFLQKLRQLKANGKRVYVITATHDYGQTTILDDGSDPQPGVTYRNELRGLYNEFGFREAIAEFEQLSYVVQLAPGYRLLALNDDGDGRAFCGYYEPQLAWILEQIRKAREDGEFLFAMTHHPVLPPSPVYPLISRRDMLGDYENCAKTLADAGLRFIFTGHTHMQNIGCLTTESGNRLYDINTGSLVGFDTPIRKVTVDEKHMTVETQRVETERVNLDLGGKTLSDYLRDHFDFLLKDIFDAAANDIDRLAAHSGGFSVDAETVYKYRAPIQAIGKALDTMTLGMAGYLCFCPQRVDKSIRHIKIKDLLPELVRNIYAGDEPYSIHTPIGNALLAIAGNLNTLGNPLIEKLGLGDLRRFLAPIIYDPTPDNNAVLPLKG